MRIKHSEPLFKFADLKADGAIRGYASTFGGEPDAYGDIIAPGAFADSIAAHRAKGRMPKMFWQHDAREPIGSWRSMSEDDTGLVVEGQLNLEVQRAREAYALLKAGDIEGLSIGYRIVEFTRNEDEDTWTLDKLDLIEVSVVSVPANENASVADVKADRESEELLTRLKAGDRLTVREFERVLKGSLGLSNSQAERAARLHLKGPGEPADADREARALLQALRG